MSASGLRYFVDECCLGLGKLLAIARQDVVHPGHRSLPDIPVGTLDTRWMPVVAQLGLVVISRDRHIRTRPAERRLFREHGVRAVWIAGKRDVSTWDMLRLIVRRWEDIEEVVDTRGAGPWFLALYENRMASLPV